MLREFRPGSRKSWLVYKLESARRSKCRTKRIGCAPCGRPIWTAAEDAIVRSLYPDYTAIVSRLKGRSLRAIRSRSLRLGITITKHQWTGGEISRLRKLYPKSSYQDLVQAFPGLNLRSIAHQANRHGIRRAKHAYKVTGITVIDQIRKRCSDLGYTMPDLDSLAKTSGYFSTAGWTFTRKADMKMADRAVRALDGELLASWSEA